MLEKKILELQAKINSRLDILLPESGHAYDSVISAARYSLLQGGKRIRPFILLEFYKLCGGIDDCAYNFACALEMIHTYSLIHDDLPCMDNDDMRRGKPSCHREFGETLAILAGDTLLTDAFGVAARTVGIDAERINEALVVLSNCAGTAGMVGGQVIDTACDKNSEAEEIIEMYRLKTGALLKAASLCGAILAGADERTKQAAAEYGENLGIAFQLVDDILDYEGDSAVLGKPIKSDEKNQKNTIISIMGIEACRQAADSYTSNAIELLKTINGDTETLELLTAYLLSRKK